MKLRQLLNEVINETNKFNLKDPTEIPDWLDSKYKEYGSKNKFLSSDEYKSAYPELMKLYKKQTKNPDTVKLNNMTRLGLNVGDKVVYDYITPYMQVIPIYGEIILKNNEPFVKLKPNDYTSKKYVPLHSGFIKIN